MGLYDPSDLLSGAKVEDVHRIPFGSGIDTEFAQLWLRSVINGTAFTFQSCADLVVQPGLEPLVSCQDLVSLDRRREEVLEGQEEALAVQ